MPDYAGSEWMARAARRKVARDAARARFEGLAGMTPVRRPSEQVLPPAGQLLKVVRLLQVTRDAGAEIDRNALVDMAKALASVGLGKGPMGAVGEHLAPIEDMLGARLMPFFHPDYLQRRW